MIQSIRITAFLLGLLMMNLSLIAQSESPAATQDKEVERTLSRKYAKEKKRLYTPNNKDKTIAKKMVLDSVASEIEAQVPYTYTHYITSYKSSDNKTEAYILLEMAYQMEPQNVEVLQEFVNHGEITQQSSLKKEFAQKLATNNAYSTPILEYNKNVLNSVPYHSIVITNGELDTYPSWVQQEVYNINPNVQVWNIENLQDKTYQNNVFKATGIPILSGSNTSREIIQHILTYKPHGEIYLTLTMPHDVLKTYSNHLYLTGLALNYNINGVANNLTTLQNNWESKFDLSHQLDSHQINRNYLIPMIQLYNHYQVLGEKRKADHLKKMIKQLAKSQNIPNPLSP